MGRAPSPARSREPPPAGSVRLRHSEPPSAQSWVMATDGSGSGASRATFSAASTWARTSASSASSSASGDAGLDEPRSLRRDRVASQPGLDLFLGPVGARVGPRVPAVAVGDRLDERRAAAGTGPVDSLAGHRVDRLHVVAVDDEVLEPVARRAVGRRPLDRGDRSDRGVLHVLVVLADEDDRRLPHDRQVQRLVERADVRRPVAEEADRDLAAARGTARTRPRRPRSADGRRRSRTTPSRRARRR